MTHHQQQECRTSILSKYANCSAGNYHAWRSSSNFVMPVSGSLESQSCSVTKKEQSAKIDIAKQSMNAVDGILSDSFEDLFNNLCFKRRGKKVIAMKSRTKSQLQADKRQKHAKKRRSNLGSSLPVFEKRSKNDSNCGSVDSASNSSVGRESDESSIEMSSVCEKKLPLSTLRHFDNFFSLFDLQGDLAKAVFTHSHHLKSLAHPLTSILPEVQSQFRMAAINYNINLFGSLGYFLMSQEDTDVCRISLKHKKYAPAVAHAQQAIEKALKAVLLLFCKSGCESFHLHSVPRLAENVAKLGFSHFCLVSDRFHAIGCRNNAQVVARLAGDNWSNDFLGNRCDYRCQSNRTRYPESVVVHSCVFVNLTSLPHFVFTSEDAANAYNLAKEALLWAKAILFHVHCGVLKGQDITSMPGAAFVLRTTSRYFDITIYGQKHRLWFVTESKQRSAFPKQKSLLASSLSSSLSSSLLYSSSPSVVSPVACP